MAVWVWRKIWLSIMPRSHERLQDQSATTSIKPKTTYKGRSEIRGVIIQPGWPGNARTIRRQRTAKEGGNSGRGAGGNPIIPNRAERNFVSKGGIPAYRR